MSTTRSLHIVQAEPTLRKPKAHDHLSSGRSLDASAACAQSSLKSTR